MVPGCLHSEFQNLDLDNDEAQENLSKVARPESVKSEAEVPRCRS